MVIVLTCFFVISLALNAYVFWLLRQRKSRDRDFRQTQIVTLDQNLRLTQELALAKVSYRETIQQLSTEIAQHQETSEALIEVEQRFRLMISSVREYAIFMLNSSGLISTWTEGAQRITGYKEEDILGQHFSLLYPASQIDIPFEELRKTARSGHSEMIGTRVKADGRHFQAKLVISAIKDISGKLNGYAVVLSDVTERLHMQTQLQSAKEEAEAANRAKSAFLANMSHEIRTPLGVILGMSDMISTGEISEKERADYTEAIKRNGDLLLRIINDVLDISKVESGRIEIDNAPMDFMGFIMDIHSLLNWRAAEKGLSLRFQIPDNIPPRIRCDALRLKQILVNLLNNAIKFTEHGFILLKVQEKAGYICFEVTDTGIGMNREQQARLFSPFMQADASTARRFGGTGLGLALSRGLAEAMHGSLDLERSAEGEGSTFVLRMPLESAWEEIIPEKDAEQIAASITLEGLKVLLVDDTPDNLLLVSRILRKEGAIVETCDSALKAIKRVEEESYTVILMDLQMPEMDGYQATKILRRKGFQQPIFALTAHAFREEKLRCLASGFDGHLTKPVDKMQLIKVLTPLAKKMALAG